MKKLIITSFAYKKGYRSGVSYNSNCDKYLQYCFISLLSFKNNNPECDVALVTNIELPEKHQKRFDREGIRIITKEFTEFTFSKDYTWSLAFYKICALKHVVDTMDYDEYLIVDSDTYCINNLDDMWQDAKDSLMLYNLNHSLSVKQSQTMNREYYELFGEDDVRMVNYGGEYVCGHRELLKKYLLDCEAVYRAMQEKDFSTKHGDEFIWCSTAHRYNYRIKAANAYIFRFWTSWQFYLVTTSFVFNPISILHLPSEKRFGFLYVYRYYERKKRLPANKRLFKMMSLPSHSPKRNFYFLKRNFMIIKERLSNKIRKNK